MARDEQHGRRVLFGIISDMNRNCLFAVIVAAGVSAFGLELPQLPAPEFIDTEVVAHHVLDQGIVGTWRLDFTLVFNGSSSNNVEVAFGCDADGSGDLASHETDLIIGWDCGRYFIEHFKGGERFEETNVGTNGIERSLDWHYVVGNKKRKFKGFAATNEVGVAFADLSANLPRWLYSGDWNLMRLTARGVDVQDEHFDVQVLHKGLLINLR